MKYQVTITRKAIIQQEAKIEVEADNQETAEWMVAGQITQGIVQWHERDVLDVCMPQIENVQ